MKEQAFQDLLQSAHDLGRHRRGEPVLGATISAGSDASVRYRHPDDVPKIDVCPRCLRPVVTHAFECGEMAVTTSHCEEHGDVVPMRSAVCNPSPHQDDFFILQTGESLKTEKRLIACKLSAGQYGWVSIDDVGASVASKSIPIGSVEFVRAYASAHGISMPPSMSYPESIRKHLRRPIRLSVFGDARPDEFVKPVEAKVFTGGIKSSVLEHVPSNTPVWVSDAVSFSQELRIYVIEGGAVGYSRYDDEDDEDAPIPAEFIVDIIHDFRDAPAGYCIDIGLTPKGWMLVEANDGWALGYYPWGTMTIEAYMDLIAKRWRQIVADNKMGARP